MLCGNDSSARPLSLARHVHGKLYTKGLADAWSHLRGEGPKRTEAHRMRNSQTTHHGSRLEQRRHDRADGHERQDAEHHSPQALPRQLIAKRNA